MEIAEVNGVELEYEVVGSGEPTLLIDMLIADSFVPILTEPSLDRCQLIRYHKRGWVGSTHTPPPVSIADHGDDAERCSTISAYRALTSWVTPPEHRSEPSSPSTTPTRCRRSRSWSRRSCRCHWVRSSSTPQARCSRPMEAATTRVRLRCSWPPRAASNV